jgi:hypothetical protein
MGDVGSVTPPDYIQNRLDADEEQQDSELQKIEDQYGIPFTNRDFRYVLFSYITRMDELIEALEPDNFNTKMMTRMANRVEFYFDTLLEKHRLLTIAYPAQSNEIDEKLSMLYYGHPNIASAFRDHLMRLLDKVEKRYPDIAEKCAQATKPSDQLYNFCNGAPCVDLALDFKKESIPDNKWLLYNATPECKQTFRAALGPQQVFQRIAGARSAITNFNKKVSSIVDSKKSGTLSGERAISKIEDEFESVHKYLEGFMAVFEEGKKRLNRAQLKQIIKEELEIAILNINGVIA